MTGIRSFLAPNPGLFTMDGTVSYVVGVRQVAVIDPGPDAPSHLDALAGAASDAELVHVLVTHAHSDHAAGAARLAEMVGCQVHGPGGERPVVDGDEIVTDEGPLRAVATPGHAREHFCYELEGRGALFAGDMILGAGDTTWIGEYSGAVADYLSSLAILEELAPQIIYPGHGKPLHEAADAIRRFREHRLERIDQVKAAVAGRGDLSAVDLAAEIYGPLPSYVFEMAVKSVEAILDYLSGAR